MKNNSTLEQLIALLVPKVIVTINNRLQGNGMPMDLPGRMLLTGDITRTLFDNEEIYVQIAQSFLKDKDLCKLFPSVSDKEIDKLTKDSLLKVSSNIITNSGSGGTQQLIGILSSLIAQAIDIAIITDKSGSSASFISAIPNAITQLRDFANGSEVEMPLIIGLTGFTADENINIEIDRNTHIRSLSEIEQKLLLGMQNQSTNVALFINLKQKILFNGDWDTIDKKFKSGEVTVSKEFVNLNEKIDNIKLSMILSLSDDDMYFSVSESGSYTSSLLTNGAYMRHFYSSEIRPTTSLKLYNKDGKKMIEKYAKIMSLDTSSIAIAKRRLLTATSQRTDPADSYIDAVTCWENIIGPEHEVAFQVCAAIAVLLSDTAITRASKYEKLKKIYDQRSKLVHGSSKFKEAQLYENSKEAIMTTINLMNVVIDNRSELLKSKPEHRSKSILLDVKNGEKK